MPTSPHTARPHAAIDLRSDTVTRPTAAMREAMARAEVGDDVYGEDPTARALEARIAEICGKEAALFVPSGTMGNQLAIMAHTRRGDEVVIGEGAHCAWYESGAAPALSGVQFAVAGQGGLFTADELEAAIKPDAYYHPRTSLVALENTHNRAGGRVFPHGDVVRIAAAARARGLAVHIDGARIWNASVATGLAVSELLWPADTASVCFSKGLGAPVGSALVGPRELIVRAHRFRKMLGAGMRQVGVLAAAALHALEHHRAKLVDDHRRAAALARSLAGCKGALVDLSAVETNIVKIELPGLDAGRASSLAAERGLLLNPTGPHTLRAVLHLDIDDEQAAAAASILADVIASLVPR
jgi:threonine aldolase